MSHLLPTYMEKKMEETIKTSTKITKHIVSLSVHGMVLNFILGGSMEKLWGLIRGIQFISSLSLCGMWYPANAYLVLYEVMFIASIDIYHGNQIVAYFFTFSNSDPLNSHFNNFQIGDMNFLNNSASLIFPIFFVMLF